jgi:hypothetical protein
MDTSITISEFGGSPILSVHRSTIEPRSPMPSRRPRSPVPKKRNLAAKGAKNQKSGPMKDRREPRGGAKNQMRKDLETVE